MNCEETEYLRRGGHKALDLQHDKIHADDTSVVVISVTVEKCHPCHFLSLFIYSVGQRGGWWELVCGGRSIKRHTPPRLLWLGNQSLNVWKKSRYFLPHCVIQALCPLVAKKMSIKLSFYTLTQHDACWVMVAWFSLPFPPLWFLWFGEVLFIICQRRYTVEDSVLL